MPTILPSLRGLAFAAALSILPSLAGASILDEVAGDLVQLNENGNLRKADPSVLQGKELIAVYYSAHWCPPCRNFTPKLVEYYNLLKQDHPEFELIFVSSDRDEEAMEEYMNWGKMPWPAVQFRKVKDSPLRQFDASGIPYLIVLDGSGNVVIEKPAGEDWMSPGIAIQQLEGLLKKGS